MDDGHLVHCSHSLNFDHALWMPWAGSIYNQKGAKAREMLDHLGVVKTCQGWSNQVETACFADAWRVL